MRGSISIEKISFSKNCVIIMRPCEQCLRHSYFGTVYFKKVTRFKYSKVCIPLLLPFSAVDGVPAHVTGQMMSPENQRSLHQFVNKSSIFHIIWCCVGLVVSESASHTVGREFASRPGHTKDHHKNGINCFPA